MVQEKKIMLSFILTICSVSIIEGQDPPIPIYIIGSLLDEKGQPIPFDMKYITDMTTRNAEIAKLDAMFVKVREKEGMDKFPEIKTIKFQNRFKQVAFIGGMVFTNTPLFPRNDLGCLYYGDMERIIKGIEGYMPPMNAASRKLNIFYGPVKDSKWIFAVTGTVNAIAGQPSIQTSSLRENSVKTTRLIFHASKHLELITLRGFKLEDKGIKYRWVSEDMSLLGHVQIQLSQDFRDKNSFSDSACITYRAARVLIKRLQQVTPNPSFPQYLTGFYETSPRISKFARNSYFRGNNVMPPPAAMSF